MKYSTAQTLVEKMINGNVVKIRGTKHNGLSSKTWCMICNVLFDVYGAKTCNYTVSKDNKIHCWYHNKNGIDVTVSDNIILF